MTELSFAQKYADAFWRLVPIPALVAANVIAFSLHPAQRALIALAVLAIVGACIEVVLWHRLRLRWHQGLDPASVGKLFEPHRRREAVIASILSLAAISLRAFTVAEGFGNALIAIVIMVGIFGAAIAFDVFQRRR